MTVKLDWQFGEEKDDELPPSAPAAKVQPGSLPRPRYGVYERNPALVRLRLSSRFTTKEHRNNLYIVASLLVFSFLWAMYFFV